MNKEENKNKENDWANDPEVQDFLEHVDKQGPWDSEDDKIHTVGGLTNDKDGSFMKFQKKLADNDIQDKIQVEEILQEANAYNLRQEVMTTADMFIKDDPQLNIVAAHQMAYMEWVK